MDHRVRVRRVRLDRRSDDEASFAMRLDAGADKRDLSLEDEVARELSPCELELVQIRPHVRAAGARREPLRDGIGGRRAHGGWRADVAAILKLADLPLPLCNQAGQR